MYLFIFFSFITSLVIVVVMSISLPKRSIRNYDCLVCNTVLLDHFCYSMNLFSVINVHVFYVCVKLLKESNSIITSSRIIIENITGNTNNDYVIEIYWNREDEGDNTDYYERHLIILPSNLEA